MFKKVKKIYIVEEIMRDSTNEPSLRIYKSMKAAKEDFAETVINLLSRVSNDSMTNETHMINFNCQHDILSTEYCQYQQHACVDDKIVTLKVYLLRNDINDKYAKMELDDND